MVILGYRVGPLLKRTGKEILDDNVLGLAAQTAYYFFFSLFPLLLFSAPILSLAGQKREVYDAVFLQLRTALPSDAWNLVNGVLQDVVYSESAPGLMSLGALLAAWAGSNIFTALIDALNRAYDVTETRPWWRKKLLSLAAVLVAGLVLVTATTIMLAGEDIVHWLGGTFGFSEQQRLVWTVVQFPLVFLMLVGLAWMLYNYLPNVRQDRTQALAGAVVTTVLWIAVTLAFRFYVQNFADYNKTYGAIGGVIVLLLWMYLSMLVVLIGGELNAELHHGTGAVRPRSGIALAGRITSGQPTPSTARVERVLASPRRD